MGGNVQAKTGDNMKAFQRSERKIKELQFQNDEDKKNQVAMSELANKLQQKIKTYKKQIEEAEEIAALNLAKLRTGPRWLELSFLLFVELLLDVSKLLSKGLVSLVTISTTDNASTCDVQFKFLQQ